ncbi:putative immunity protein [Blastococcus sp. SYSU DS1021]
MPQTGSGDPGLTTAELRLVARYAVECAEEALPLFERAHPDDHRPRAAVDAAWAFVRGADRSTLQRVTSLDAHRAAKAAATGPAKHAAHAAGDAAAAAYLHPPGAVLGWASSAARASQVGHILRAAAHAARAAELAAGGEPGVGDRHLGRARLRAIPDLADVVRRYPRPPAGTDRVGQLLHVLDTSLREP